MSGERYARIKQILLAARGLPTGERAAFLERECGGDASLREEVESLLSLEQAPAPIIQSGALAQGLGNALAGAVQEAAARAAPARIGPYRVLEPLGEGGMGEVFRAEQSEPIRRVVALKLIRRGLDSGEFVRRFEAERQILARLEHPGIARLIDGGVTEDGLPWFTMEFVDGVPLDRFCDEHVLPIEKRLLLFRAVCAAVQFAHRNLVVHRDLKPGNILVTGDGLVKLLDFGIAKVLRSESDGAQAPARTRTELRVLTPEYAAPEQIRNEPVTTATDVYSLGVILYELLCGCRPYALTGRSSRELEDAVLTAEPALPSTAPRRAGGRSGAAPASSQGIAAARGTDPDRLRRKLAGDLDTICLKALRKEPERRYASADQLDEDLRRYLEGLPVRARRDTLAYRAGKFVRRHRSGVVAAAAVVAVLAAVVSAYTVRLREERDRAREARDASEAVTEFLSGMLSAPDPSLRGRDVTVRAVLDSASRSIEREFAGRPAIAARLELAVGRAYHGLGDYPEAERHLGRAVELGERDLGRDREETMSARIHLIFLYSDQGRFREAESLTVRNLADRRRWSGPEHEETLRTVNSLAQLSAFQGRFAAAESLYRENLAACRRVLGEENPNTQASMGLLANLYADQSRFAEAEPLYVKLLEIRRRTRGAEHPMTLSNMNNLALLYMQTHRNDLAEPLFRQTIEIRRRVLGDEHPETVATMYNLATLYTDEDRFEESGTLLRGVLRIWRRDFGEENPRTLVVKNNLARLHAKAGRYAEAEALYRETVAARRRVLGGEHPSTLGSVVNLAGVLRDRGGYAEAEPVYRDALATQRRVLGVRHANTLNTLFNLGTLYVRRAAFARAESLLQQAVDGLRSELGEGHPDWARYATALGECQTALGRYAEAESVLRRAFDRQAGGAHPERRQLQETAAALARLYAAWGKPDEAGAWRARAEEGPGGGR